MIVEMDVHVFSSETEKIARILKVRRIPYEEKNCPPTPITLEESIDLLIGEAIFDFGKKTLNPQYTSELKKLVGQWYYNHMLYAEAARNRLASMQSETAAQLQRENTKFYQRVQQLIDSAASQEFPLVRILCYRDVIEYDESKYNTFKKLEEEIRKMEPFSMRVGGYSPISSL
ncbi:MAG: hypothetical protein V2A62_00835 [Candidatus Woesearchaeota archaeon]